MNKILRALLLAACFTSPVCLAASAANASATKQAPVDNTPLAAAVARLEQTRANLDAGQIAFRKTIQEKVGELAKLGEVLDTIASAGSNSNAAVLSEGYAQANTLWETAVERTQTLFSDLQLATDDRPSDLFVLESFSSEEEKSRYQTYVAAYRDIQLKRRLFEAERSQLLNKLRIGNFKLLSDAGTVRAKLMQLCDQHSNCERSRGLNSRNLKDTLRELRAVPLRTETAVLEKYQEVRSKVLSGLDGWLNLLYQMLVLGVIVTIPFMLRRILQGVSRHLDGWRRNLLSHSMPDPRHRTRVAILISRLNPFIPSIGLIVSTHIAQSLIEATDLEVLADLLNYLLIYFYFQATRILLGILMEMAFSTSSVQKLHSQQTEIESSARRIAGLFFIEYHSCPKQISKQHDVGSSRGIR